MGEVSNLMVVVMGLCTVFIGLIFLIFICKIMGYLCAKFVHEEDVAVQNPTAEQAIPNKQELIAAISAAIAEDAGKAISQVRVHAIKKL